MTDKTFAEEMAEIDANTAKRVREIEERHARGVRVLWYIVIPATILLGIAWWIGSSAMEAAAYNRVTGKDVSTWDAMWIELRVQEGAK